MKFTDNLVKGLQPKDIPYRLFEKGADKGFGLQVTPSGTKSFFLQYANNGKRKYLNLGRYPSTSLSEAREKARINREQLIAGSHLCQSTYVLNGSLEDLFHYYINRLRSEGKRSWKKVQADIEYNVFSVIDKTIQLKMWPPLISERYYILL